MAEHVCDPTNPDCAAYQHYQNPANLQPAEDAAIYRVPTRRLTRHVPIRFAADTIERAKRAAEGEGLTVSSWIRRTVERELARQQPATVSLGTFNSRWSDEAD